MSSNEKAAKISCKCGACEFTLADEKSTVSFLCGCEDCRQALQWGFKNGGVEPDPLPRLYYMRSDITDVKGRDKMVAVKLREDGRSTRVYCTNCYSILGVDNPSYRDNIFLNFPEHCINPDSPDEMAFGQLRAPISIVKSISYAGSSSRILADPTGERRNRQFRQRFCGLRSCRPDPPGESGVN